MGRLFWIIWVSPRYKCPCKRGAEGFFNTATNVLVKEGYFNTQKGEGKMATNSETGVIEHK